MQIHVRSDVVVEAFSEEKISLVFPHTKLALEKPAKPLYKRLKNLMGYGSKNLEKDHSLAEMFYLVGVLKKAGLISYSLMRDEKPLLTLNPYEEFELEDKKVDPTLELKISRFAYIHPSKTNEFVLESPLLPGSVALKSKEALLFFYAFAEPKSLNALVKKFSSLPEDTVSKLFSFFYNAKLLSNADEKPTLKCWEFHDLLFHTRARTKHDGGSGGTFRFLEKIEPLPALKKVSGDLISLKKPDLDALMKNDPPFAKVLEERKSTRENKKDPITLDQLSEFLYRTARLKKMRENPRYEASQRPYPGGGACYELELYLVVNNCSGLNPGLYRYVPDQHALEIISSEIDAGFELLERGMQATSQKELSQVMILMAARFQRVTWKYESMAYSVILKNTGVLIQTMYLAATAMGLSACAVGNGDSRLFAKVAKTDFHEETTVGEFLLGS